MCIPLLEIVLRIGCRMLRYIFPLFTCLLLAFVGFPACSIRTSQKSLHEVTAKDSDGIESKIEPIEWAVERAHPDAQTRDGKVCKTVLLLDHSTWEKVERSEDPYKELAPPGPCNDVAYKLEDGVIEVETGICSFVTVRQPLKHALKKGDTLQLIYWHLQLTAASSAYGFFSLTLGTQRIHVNKIPIPSAPQVYEVNVPIKQSFAKGTPLYFHIHNHGSNTWKLLDLNRVCK